MCRWLAALSLVGAVLSGAHLLAPAAASADEVATSDMLALQVEMFADQVRDRLDMVEIGDYAAGDLLAGVGPNADVDLVLDVRERKARFTFGGGDDRFVALRVDARLRFERGLPRIKGKLDLGVVGKRVTISLPEITVRPRSYQGEVYLEYQIPILEAKF
jgi:hypothetical protein